MAAPLKHLRHIKVLRSLTMQHLVGFATHCTHGSCAKGDAVYRQGEKARRVFFLVEGMVKMTCRVNGFERIPAVFSSGVVLGGSAALVPADRRSHSLVALTRLEGASCSVDRFRKLLIEHPDLGLRYTLGVHEQSRRFQEQIVRLTTASARDRLAAALVDLASRFGDETPEGVLIKIPLRRDELGQYVGVRRETISTLLRELREQDLVDYGRGWYRVRDLEALSTA